MNAATTTDLFDAAFLAALDGLSLRAREAQKGGRLADQRTRARGQGSEFADFKPYVPGDDLRAVDWNIYRRLGRAFVRVFEERQDLPVYLLVDASRSMFVETPPRIDAARRVALAIAAITLRQHDAVSVMPFGQALSVSMRAASGRATLPRVAQILAAIEPMGTTALTGVLAQAGAMRLRRGLMVIVSDFFDPAGIDAVTAAIGRLPHRILLVQMVREHDADPRLSPDLDGDVILDDGEGAAGAAVTITPELLARYGEVYRAFSDRLGGFAHGRGIGLARIDAARPVIGQLTQMFRDGALLL